ncbi:MAG: porin [Gammaproteobacteria bacterium]|nr:porin [Gammaproteobacteria bacterium]
MLLLLTGLFLSAAHAATEFNFGGFIKANMIASDYQDGDIGAGNALRDFYLPGSVPVGEEGDGYEVDFHAKESRFNLGTVTDLANGKQVKTFFEMDFMLSDAGDERVSNSYQPRLRHAYFTYDKFLFGQTWSTFMIVTLPDSLDFIGTPNGMVFVRQSQFRYTSGNWQFALENPDTTVTPYLGGTRINADSSSLPDLVARYNFGGDWGALSVAGIYRQLSYDVTTENIDSTENGYGITFGGKIKTGSTDDLRFAVTGGSGLGRYAGLNFVNGAVLDANSELEAIDTLNGYVAYLHHWNNEWRSSFSIAAFEADNNAELTGTDVNKSASSASINLIYSPDPKLTFGIELMRANRELESGVDGSFNRIQFSAKYNFSFSSTTGN